MKRLFLISLLPLLGACMPEDYYANNYYESLPNAQVETPNQNAYRSPNVHYHQGAGANYYNYSSYSRTRDAKIHRHQTLSNSTVHRHESPIQRPITRPVPSNVHGHNELPVRGNVHGHQESSNIHGHDSDRRGPVHHHEDNEESNVHGHS